MVVKYFKDGKPTTMGAIKSITLVGDKFVCITDNDSEISIPESDFIQCT